MKKGIIVLLIAVLVAGFAFADGTAGKVTFTGSAQIGYEFDLQSKDHGIFNDSGLKYSFKFQFDSSKGESKGEGKLYAEIEATADFYVELKKKANNDTATPILKAKITKANIVALNGDLVINILGPEGFYDYAMSYVVDGDGNAIWDKANGEVVDDHGFVATYKDFSVALSFYHWEEFLPGPLTQLYVGAQTPAFKLADGMTIQAGANFAYVNSTNLLGLEVSAMSVGGGFKFDYAPEDSKISAFFAGDVEFVDASVDNENDEVLPLDFSAGATYDFVTVDAYFGTDDKFDENTNTLAGRVKVAYDVNDQLSVGASAEAIWPVLNDATKPILAFKANVDYTAEKFAAYAGVTVTMQDGADGYELAPWQDYANNDYAGLGIECGVSTTALIDNATVALDYTRSDFAKAGDDFIDLGLIQASVTVSF